MEFVCSPKTKALEKCYIVCQKKLIQIISKQFCDHFADRDTYTSLLLVKISPFCLNVHKYNSYLFPGIVVGLWKHTLDLFQEFLAEVFAHHVLKKQKKQWLIVILEK